MISKEEAKKGIKRLVDIYERYKSSGDIKNFEGKEQNTKTTFILPLFKALGWDVHNEKNVEVVSEERVLKGAVDYAFRLGGQNKFFVEAKPIGSGLKEHAKQAIEYGVNSGNAWVVLTNFESIIIFNCEWKEKDWWKNALFGQLDYKDYLNNFDMLWLLSKESITSGKLDEWATRVGKKVPRTPIDKELLSKFLEWRLKLSKDISKNHSYSIEEIDELVQKLLIRLLFIKNCEDRGFETNYKLLPVAEAYKTHKKGMLRLLRRIFDYYDNTYDSSIFENGEVDKISFDEDLLSEILNGLYFTPDNYKYNFNVIPADVMGNLYEQYLGHILKKTPQTAKLKEGKAHRKEQGIYYTPTYIVDYIVRNTLGELLKNKKVDASKIRVLDLACGSGSFLVKAFDVLNEHYSKDKMYGQKTLAGYSTKERILKDNIFGVDLDKQAVEIAQLNLLLRIAEKGQKLPLLKQNIKIGNSLIDDEKVAGDKAFKWEEQFADIMKGEGFDVVIGNPPYVRQEEIKEMKSFFEKRFPQVFIGTADLYVYFFARGLEVLKEGGYFAFIVSNKFTKSGYGINLRRYISENFKIVKYFDNFKDKVFDEATVDPCIIIIKKEKPNKNHKIVCNDSDEMLQSNLSLNGWSFSSKSVYDIKSKIESKGKKIKDHKGVSIFFGIKSGLNEAFILDEPDLRKFDKKSQELIKPLLRGRDISRNNILFNKKYLLLVKIGVDIDDFLDVKKHLEPFKNKLTKRTDYKPGQMKWYNLRSCDYYDAFTKPKIIYPDISENGGFYYDEENYFFNNTVYMIAGGIKKYWVAFLNSKLISWYYKQIASNLGKKGVRYFTQFVENIPLVEINKENEKVLNNFVDKMLSLNKRLNELGDKKTDERARIEEEIKKTDQEIDELVYKIYGITGEEKKIIEESLKR